MQIVKRYWKQVRSKDMFGHLITLNFNKRGQHHKTQIGGLFSIIIKLFINIYVLLNFNTMFMRNANVNSSISSMESFEKFGKVNVNETDHFVIYNKRNQTTEKDIMLVKDLKNYIRIYF